MDAIKTYLNIIWTFLKRVARAVSTFAKRHQKEILLATIAVVTTILVVCVIVLAEDYEKGLDRQAEDAALLQNRIYNVALDDAVNDMVERTRAVAANLPAQSDQFREYLSKSSEIAFYRYVKDGAEYRADCQPFDMRQEPKELQALIEQGEIAVSGVFTDRHGNTDSEDGTVERDVIAAYVPVENHAEVDGLIAYFHVRALVRHLYIRFDIETESAESSSATETTESEPLTETESDVADSESVSETDPYAHLTEEERRRIPRFFAFCSTEGEFLRILATGELEAMEQENLFDQISKWTSGTVTENMLLNGTHPQVSLTAAVNGERHVIALESAEHAPGRLYSVAIYRSADIYRNGYQLIGSISTIVIILFVIVGILLALASIARYREITRGEHFEFTNSLYGCLSYQGFVDRATRILQRNKLSNYAVAYISVPHIESIRKTWGEENATDTVKFVVSILEKAMLTDEVFGMIDEEKYAVLLHYHAPEDIYNRITVLNVALYNCPVTQKRSYHLKQNVGVCAVDHAKSVAVGKLLDCAIIAEQTHDNFARGNVRIYTERLHEIFLRQSEIESKMEASLKNGDFRLFFQPKYNIAKNHIDSAEILVRWYDSEYNRYYQPSEFLPLFEANGFIREIDRYMFVEACRSLQQAIDSGGNPAPLSLNVSRVTALDPDFLDFYIGNKRKFGVPDHMLTLEFTDSFVYECLDSLKGTVSKLHAAGIRCSIDNFGAGHSSLNVLKLLSMDELKLDRFFIKTGVSRDRDDCLLVAVIALARQLGMTVVQQGVEDLEELNRLREAGCDVVQGYLYARPLPADEYAEFVSRGGHLHAN